MAVVEDKSAERSDAAEVSLEGILAEFRIALREEIEASRRNASSAAVPLTGGNRIGMVGSQWQYRFTVENILNMPGDAPGDLLLPDRKPLEAMVIAVEGTWIVISVGVDLGPHVPTARLQSNLTMLMRKLISRIEEHHGNPNPGGDRLLGTAPVNGTPMLPARTYDQPLNAGQEGAVAAVLGRDTTFIWGPPGTGKTQTIGAIGAELFDLDASLLVVSHTNTAVDQALLKIGEALRATDPDALAAGKVLRVGDPADRRLADWDELLLSTHVDRRSSELAERRDALVDERFDLVGRVLELSRLITVAEWADLAPDDIAASRAALTDLADLEAQRDEATRAAASLEAKLAALADDVAAAQVAANAAADLSVVEARRTELADAAKRNAKAALDAHAAEADAQRVLDIATDLEPLRVRAEQLPNRSEHERIVTRLRREAADAAHASANAETDRANAAAVLEEIRSVGGLARRWRGLPKEDEQEAVVEQYTGTATSAAAASAAAFAELAAAEATLAELDEIDKTLAPQAEVPRLADARTTWAKAGSRKRSAEQRQTRTLEELAEASSRAEDLARALTAYERAYGRPYAEVLADRDDIAERLSTAVDTQKRTAKEAKRRRKDLTDRLADRLAALREWDLTAAGTADAESMQADIEDAHAEAMSRTAGRDVSALESERNGLNTRVRAIEADVDEIDDQLRRIEEVVIAEATIVATTLTRAYLRDSIQARRFDTVLLDEASMAPIPALWVAASLADRAVVAVGDFLQLPPIAVATHPMAKAWLARDIFEVAGVDTVTGGPAHLVRLTEQYRMHPAISTIPNELPGLYDGQLTNHPSTEDDDSLTGWYRQDWGHDTPVLLVNTASTGAWVTSVARGNSASRLNFLSATICIDLAEQLLRDDRPSNLPGARPRILIVSPYRPQGQLLNVLVAEHDLTGDVLAGTAHTFQGSEADIVILDLVNDEPHWRVGLFMADVDESNRRLFNVAITRAKRRLIVVGDLDYNQKQGRKAFLGRHLLPLLRDRYPEVDALDIVPQGLAARVAQGQEAMLGGDVEPDTDRVVVTQDHFYDMLAGDLSRARHRVVIYSAFITANRLGYLEPQLRAATARGIDLYVVTRANDDLKKSERAEYLRLQRTLADWGAVVIHKRHMHEKLVFVDDHILWSGSLNPLSFSNTQEVMERRDNRKVAGDYAAVLRLDDLVGGYADGYPTCPICGADMEVAEGDREPFYWRCPVKGCYTRSIDTAPITGGVITCPTCTGAVRFGEWGGEPHWRCEDNPRHRLRVVATHLKLPKMRALIDDAILDELDGRWGISGGTLL